MPTKTALPFAALVAGFFIAGVTPAFAQAPTAVDTAQSVNTTQQLQQPLLSASGQQTAPVLYESELEDIGPQYVLQPKEKFKYFLVSGDFQLYRTNNAALAQSGKVASDVSVVSIQAIIQSKANYIWKDLMMKISGGVTLQHYWYGVFSGRNQLISGGTLAKYNDFTTFTPHIEATFNKGDWYGSLGLHYSAFANDNAVSYETFYQEWAPTWTIGKQFNLDPNNIIQVQYDGDYRGTHTDEKNAHPTGYEDRADNSISLIYSHIFNNHWVIQPSYRLSSAEYTNYARNRSDVYNTLSLMVAYYFNSWSSARLFTSYEWRDSSEAFGSYENWNIGVGGSVSLSF